MRQLRVLSGSLTRFLIKLLRSIAKETPHALRRVYYAVLIITALLSISTRPMLLENLHHLRLQFVFLLVLGVIFLRFRSRIWLLLGLLAITLNGLQVYPFYFPRVQPNTGTSNFRILLSNVFQINDNYDSVSKLIQEEDPAMVVLVELTAAWNDALAADLAKYPYRATKVMQGDFGIGVFSKHPIANQRIVAFTDESPPAVVLDLLYEQKTIRVVAVHTWPPITLRNFRIRNQDLERIATVIAEERMPTILAGDLNITSLSPYFQDLIHNAALIDPRVGRGLIPTCPTFLPILWVPFDHILHTKDISLTDFRRGPYVGSDHFPLIADFKL